MILDGTQARRLAEKKEQNVQRYQAIFNIDMYMWEQLIDAFDITEPMIPDRKREDGAQVSATGWYG